MANFIKIFNYFSILKNINISKNVIYLKTYIMFLIQRIVNEYKYNIFDIFFKAKYSEGYLIFNIKLT